MFRWGITRFEFVLAMNFTFVSFTEIHCLSCVMFGMHWITLTTHFRFCFYCLKILLKAAELVVDRFPMYLFCHSLNEEIVLWISFSLFIFIENRVYERVCECFIHLIRVIPCSITDFKILNWWCLPGIILPFTVTDMFETRISLIQIHIISTTFSRFTTQFSYKVSSSASTSCISIYNILLGNTVITYD